jgi:cellulase
MPWGENILHLTPSYYRVTIPAGLQNGEYMLRHEVSLVQEQIEGYVSDTLRDVQILGLHVAGTLMGAQFVSSKSPLCALVPD